MDDASMHVTAAAARDGTPEEALIAQLRAAVASRQLIGQATGVLIAVYRISDSEAWAMLSATSQNTNIKVARLAQALVQAASGCTTVSDAPAHAALRHLPPRPDRPMARGGSAVGYAR